MASVVSLMMSDIVHSTQRWNTDERAMAADLEVHDRLVRRAVDHAGGTVFKHTGDGMIAVFDDPLAASAAAVDVQRSIPEVVWQHPAGLQVRAAVHTGVVYPRAGDLFGTAVNLVARLLDVCPPGGVTMSAVTAVLLTDRPPDDVSLVHLGSAHLQGFTTAHDVYGLCGPGLAAPMPARPASALQRPGSVPPTDDELIGRRNEMLAISHAFDRSRLVTVLGAGGIGKTRLVQEVATTVAAEGRRGVWWIDLSSSLSDDTVLPVAMAAVGAREAPGHSAVQAVCERFAQVPGLVVIDNCEHVIAGAAALVTALRSAAPDIDVLCTSREALGLRGEQIVPVGSLPVDAGVEVFARRARAVQPDLDIDEHAAVIERICARLDGIPLAIGLAAARCRSMTPSEIDARLDDRFRLLRGGRSSVERHRTLEAAVDWSYSMLTDPERTMFERLSVFAGGTLLDGLAAVMELDEFDTLDLVDRLIARSMVTTVSTPLGTRYHQLETLRQFATDRLNANGTVDDARRRHLAWATDLADHLARARSVRAEAAAFVRLAADLDNLRIAVAYATTGGVPEAAYRIVAALSYLAIYLPVFEVFDWVPLPPTDGGSTTAAASAAAFGAMADCARGLQYRKVTSIEDVPDWYPSAPTSARSIFVSAHLLSGGDWRVALDLLDRCPRDDHHDAVCIDITRLSALSIAELWGSATAEMVGERASLVEAARARGSDPSAPQTLVAAGLGIAAWALIATEPAEAAVCARRAIDLAERLGAEALVDSAVAALGTSLGSVRPSVEVLDTIRHRIDVAVEQFRLGQAVLLSVPIAMIVSRHEPDTYRRYVSVLRRHNFAFALPDDEAVGHQPVRRSEPGHDADAATVVEVIRMLLAALDRVIVVEAAADVGAEH